MTKSNKPQIKIVNAQTGQEIVRDANAEELAQMQLDTENYAIKKTAAEAKAAEKQAILDKLGLTADEAQLLLG